MDIANIKEKTLIVVGAEWCAPCKSLKKLIAENDVGVSTTVVDIDLDPDTAQQFQVRAVPFLILAENGEVVRTKAGGMDLAKLKAFIEG